ncbi:winged helix-turn-helix domain-containing protein [Oricola sp.]|uniref:winged helix-turn-helix domain-containing protein n=1 Tax=Oricola sp. TaxID=1979950 RepID=UPI003BAD09AA
MIYLFEDCRLDTHKAELRRDGALVAIEPQVLALLVLIVENHDRLLTKGEIVEKVWDGRAISESALSSRIKSARQAVGDDGTTQKIIRTIHGLGFRCNCEVEIALDQIAARPAVAAEQAVSLGSIENKPSIAVLPFGLLGQTENHTAIAEAIPHELITALARLRWISVIARGSTFRFRQPQPDLPRIGAALNARYCLSGFVEIFGKSLTISVDLTDTRGDILVWSERYSTTVDEVHDVRARIVANIVSVLDYRIPAHEARRADVSVPENLDAWSAFHLGLQHVLRFNQKDNEVAAEFFADAVAKEPNFARAHAGLAFTAFRTAFLRQTDDLKAQIELTLRRAERATELDPFDPFVNLSLARSYWLFGDFDQAHVWLERALTLSPNYAHGLYAQAFTDTISGRNETGRTLVDAAVSLSPLDPFLYAMQALRSMTLIADGEYQLAAGWADSGARMPGNHYLIQMNAAAANELAGKAETATKWAHFVRTRRPDATLKHFFEAFPLRNDAARAAVYAALKKHGFD